MFFDKLFIAVAIALLFIGCGGSSGSGSGGSTSSSIATESITIQSPLLADGQTYNIEAYSDLNDTMSVYSSCTVTNGYCVANLPSVDFITDAYDVTVKLLNQNGSLVVAGLADPSYFIPTTSGLTSVASSSLPNYYGAFSFSEESTGAVILDELQTIASYVYPSALVADDIESVLYPIFKKDGYDLDITDENASKFLNVMTYVTFKLSQGSSNENQGLSNFFYSIYGLSDSNETGVNAVASVNQATSVTSLATATRKMSVSRFDPDNPPTRERSNAMVPNNLPKPDEKKLDYSKGVNDKAIEASALSLYSSLGGKPIPTTDEDKKNLALAFNIAQVAAKTLDVAFSGVGTALSAIIAGLSGGVLPKDDPNKPLLEALNTINVSINSMQTTMKEQFAQSLQSKYSEKQVTLANSMTDIQEPMNTFMASVTISPKERASGLNPKGIKASRIDVLIDNGTTTLGNVQNFINYNQIQKIKLGITKLASDEQLKNVNLSLNDVIAAKTQTAPTNFNYVVGAGYNSIASKKAAALEAYQYATKVCDLIERARQYFGGLAYLEYISKHQSNFKISTGIQGFDMLSDSNATQNYNNAVAATDTYFIDLEKKVLQNYINFMASLNIYGDSTNKTDSTYFYNNNDVSAKINSAKDALAKQTSVKTIGDIQATSVASKSCEVTYWDGVNMAYSCKTWHNQTNRTFVLGNVDNVCGSNLITKQNAGSRPNADAEFPIYGCMLKQPELSNAAIAFSNNGTELKSSNLTSFYYTIGGLGQTGYLHIFADILLNDIRYKTLGASNLSNLTVTDQGNFTDASPKIAASIMEVNYKWKLNGAQVPDYNYAGPGFIDYRTVLKSYGHAHVYYRDLNSNKPYVLSYKDGGSIGCLISNCATMVNSRDRLIQLYFDDGYSAYLRPAEWFPNNGGTSGLVWLTQNYSPPLIQSGTNAAPAGDWRGKCDVGKSIFANGWLSASCKANSSSGGDYTWSTLNYRSCTSGNVTVNGANQLACQ